MEPLYTSVSSSSAYQLRWSLSIFLKISFCIDADLLEELNDALSSDSIRILQATSRDNNCIQFLISTKPNVVPSTIVQKIKGRLKHLARKIEPIEWRRNFLLSTLGDATVKVVEGYVSSQLGHHPLASSNTMNQFKELSEIKPVVNIEERISSSHGQYVLGLHLVLVHMDRWRTANLTFQEKSKWAFCATMKKYELSYSRLSLLPDHIHATIRFTPSISPEQIALATMNNICFAHGMLRLFMNSFYVGTIGSYNMNAVRLRS